MKPNEYAKICPYCEKQFEASHLSRAYCSEKCKRRMYRVKKQEMRQKAELEKNQYLKNNLILARLYRPDLSPFKQEELIEAGYNILYMKDKIRFEDKMLVTYEDHYLEVLYDDKVRIHKKL